MITIWKKQCARDSKNLGWIVDNTRDCPKCKAPVEKNGGCNSVRCHCGHEFCWASVFVTLTLALWPRALDLDLDLVATCP
jgi:hypothetical protein